MSTVPLSISSAQAQKLGTNECPRLMECEARISDIFYQRYCRTRGFLACGVFKKHMNELDIPRVWLQKEVVLMEQSSEQYRTDGMLVRGDLD